jgi:uncharacterized protein
MNKTMLTPRRLMWTAVIALFLVIAYFALSPLALSNIFVFQPKRVSNYNDIPLTVMGAKGQAVSFTAPSGSMLHGFYFEMPHSKTTVLLHHGQGGNLSTHFGLAKTMMLAGYSVLTYDYEGFGMSKGTTSNEHLMQDGLAAYDFLVRTKHVDPANIMQCGVSLGTGVASSVAMNRPCAAVILISPYTSLNQVATDRIPIYRWYPPSLFPHPDMGSLEFIKSNFTIPVLMIHGANDPIIALHNSERLNDLAKCHHWLIVEPKAHHGDFFTVFLANKIKEFGQRVANEHKTRL